MLKMSHGSTVASSVFDLDSVDRPLIAHRYKLIKLLGKGSFCAAYLAVHVKHPDCYFCVKVEKTSNPGQKFRQLHFEGKIYEMLKNEEGFPKVRHFGKEDSYNFLAMELLGPTIEDLHAALNYKFTIQCVCVMAKQMISRLESLHKHNFIHRDIKPENFLIGRHKNSGTIYLCDMGLCKKYRDSTLHVHVPFQTGRSLAGTARYASVNALSGNEQSRRDDIESLGYLIVYLAKGHLPWQGVKGESRKQKYVNICDRKRDTSPEALCKDLPPEFTQYVAYSRQLKFSEEPNYSYLRGLFEHRLSILSKDDPETPARLDWQVQVPAKYREVILGAENKH